MARKIKSEQDKRKSFSIYPTGSELERIKALADRENSEVSPFIIKKALR